jgi:hypothetical protein
MAVLEFGAFIPRGVLLSLSLRMSLQLEIGIAKFTFRDKYSKKQHTACK